MAEMRRNLEQREMALQEQGAGGQENEEDGEEESASTSLPPTEAVSPQKLEKSDSVDQILESEVPPVS
jgi:hypothetical protein